MRKTLLAAAVLLALALPAAAQTTNVPLPTPTVGQGTITIVAMMGAGATCNVASPCVFTWTDTPANWGKLGTAYGPYCQAANLVGTPPVPTPCTNPQIFSWWAKSLITGSVNAANGVANETAKAAVVLPPSLAPNTATVIPNCGGAC